MFLFSQPTVKRVVDSVVQTLGYSPWEDHIVDSLVPISTPTNSETGEQQQTVYTLYMGLSGKKGVLSACQS